MTVVSVVKFSKKYGAIISDVRASTPMIKYDLANKLHIFDDKNEFYGIAGGSGSADFLHEIIKKSDDYVKNEPTMTPGKLPYLVQQQASQIAAKHRSRMLKGEIGISEDEFICGQKNTDQGRIPINNQKLQDYFTSVINGQYSQQIKNNSLLVITNEHEIEMYDITPSSCNHISGHYRSIGSGRESADRVLADFFEGIPRNERAKIDPVKGIIELLYSTSEAAKRNIGVGGTPYLHIIQPSGIITPNENNTKLALEFVLAQKGGYIDKNKCAKGVEELILNDSNYYEMNKLLFSKSKNQEKLSLFLRGYI